MEVRLVKFKLILPLAAALAMTAQADPLVGTLFYTTFSGGTNVHRVDYSYDGSAIVYSNNNGIAATNGADGILFAPDGNLLVSGQANNIVSEITPTGTPVGTVDAGTGSFHLALSSNAPDATLYNMWNGGCCFQISAITLVGGGVAGSAPGTTYTVAGSGSHDIRGIIYDPADGNWYYGTAPDGGSGDFGIISFSGTTATLNVLANNKFAHGLTFDPFTNTIIFSSENVITQYDPVSGLFYDLTSLPFGDYDQSAVDGHGHLFVASNSGYIVFVDYTNGSNHIDTPAFTDKQFLATSLDDIAPLSGVGSQETPEPASLILLGSALACVGCFRRKRRNA
jgi:hypothetical protein